MAVVLATLQLPRRSTGRLALRIFRNSLTNSRRRTFLFCLFCFALLSVDSFRPVHCFAIGFEFSISFGLSLSSLG